jgi:hypothetical protein
MLNKQTVHGCQRDPLMGPRKICRCSFRSAVCLNQYVFAGSRRVPATYGQYSLQGVVIHCGRSLDAGHYYSYQLVKGQWYLFNDEDVQPTTWTDLTRVAAGNRLGHCPTLLFYARRNYVDRDTSTQQSAARKRTSMPSPDLPSADSFSLPDPTGGPRPRQASGICDFYLGH